MARRKRKKKTSVNFKDVEGRTLVPEGTYRAAVSECSEEEGNEYPYIKWVFTTIDSDKKLNNKKLYTNTSLSPKALWNLRNLLEAQGVEVPDDEYELDLESYVGNELEITVEHEMYEGKKQARCVDFMPVEDDGDDEDDEDVEIEDDEDEEEDDEEEETVSEDDVKGMSRIQLNKLCKEYKLKIPESKRKPLKDYRSNVLTALEEAELLED